MKTFLKFSSLFVLLTLVLSACLPAIGATEVATIAPAGTQQPAQTQVAIREAQVKSVEIETIEGSPAQVNAVVSGELSESCARLGDAQVSYSANTFMIKLMTVSPTDRGCAQITTPYTQTIPLNTVDLPAGEYTVKANGVSAVFTLPVGQSQYPAPTPSDEAGQLKTFSSDLYHYKVSYPAGWSIDVNTKVPAGAGSDPEYVTLSSTDASGLPRISVLVQTGTPPMTGYENCEKNFVFRSLPACKISQQAGQAPATEKLMFQNGSAYFQIYFEYEDPGSLQVFNDFLTSFEFTQ